MAARSCGSPRGTDAPNVGLSADDDSEQVPDSPLADEIDSERRIFVRSEEMAPQSRRHSAWIMSSVANIGAYRRPSSIAAR